METLRFTPPRMLFFVARCGRDNWTTFGNCEKKKIGKNLMGRSIIQTSDLLIYPNIKQFDQIYLNIFK